VEEDKKRFFICSKNFISAFCKDFGLKDGHDEAVQLSNGYPDVNISYVLLRDLSESLEKGTSPTSIYRRLIKFYFPDPAIWAKNTGASI
jgi:hypothetical protein